MNTWVRTAFFFFLQRQDGGMWFPHRWFYYECHSRVFWATSICLNSLNIYFIVKHKVSQQTLSFSVTCVALNRFCHFISMAICLVMQYKLWHFLSQSELPRIVTLPAVGENPARLATVRWRDGKSLQTVKLWASYWLQQLSINCRSCYFSSQDSKLAGINVSACSVQFGIFNLHPRVQWRNVSWQSIW